MVTACDAGGCKPAQRQQPPPRDGEIRKMVSLTMDGRPKQALQTMEQDLSDAAKGVAELPEDLTGLVDNESLLGEGKDFEERRKKARKKLDTFMASLKAIGVRISRSRPPPTERFRAWLVQ